MTLPKQVTHLPESAKKVEKHGLKVRAKFQKNANISKSSIFHDLKIYTIFPSNKRNFLHYEVFFSLKYKKRYFF